MAHERIGKISNGRRREGYYFHTPAKSGGLKARLAPLVASPGGLPPPGPPDWRLWHTGSAFGGWPGGGSPPGEESRG
eukprot:4533363-Alexandrium_andersonii.AAC.1